MALSTYERVRKVMMTQLNVGGEEIAPQAMLADLIPDSLARVELLMALEEEFSVEIPDEDAERLVTVADAVTHINAKTA